MTTRFILLFSAVLLAAPALAAPADYQNAQPQSDSRQMTLEQKIAWRLEMRDQMRNMAPEERKAEMKRMRLEWRYMDDAARQQKIARLQQQWETLPDKKRDRLVERFQARIAARGNRTDRANKNNPPRARGAGNAAGSDGAPLPPLQQQQD